MFPCIQVWCLTTGFFWIYESLWSSLHSKTCLRILGVFGFPLTDQNHYIGTRVLANLFGIDFLPSICSTSTSLYNWIYNSFDNLFGLAAIELADALFMLFHLALLSFLFRHEEYLETTLEKAKSNCPPTVVGNPHREKSSNWTSFEKDPIDSCWSSLERPSFPFEDPALRDGNPKCNGQPTMEMQKLPETGKGQSTLLPCLWSTLEHCSGSQLYTGKQSFITQKRTITATKSVVGGALGWMEQSGRLVQCMARTISKIAKKPAEEEEGQRQRERGRKTTAGRERKCQRRTHLETTSPSSCLDQAKCPLECINWGKRPIETVDDPAEEKQSGLADRGTRVTPIGTSRRHQTADQNAAFSRVAAWKLQENIEGAQPSEIEVALPMVQVLGGIPHPLEWLRGQLSGAGHGATTEDRGSKTGCGKQPAEFQGMSDGYRGGRGCEGLGHRSERRGRLHSQSDKGRRSYENYADESGNYEKPDGDRLTKCKEEKNPRGSGIKRRNRQRW